MDIETGDVCWRVEASADGHLGDFDGCFLVVIEGEVSVVHDTSGQRPAIEVVGGVTLKRAPAEHLATSSLDTLGTDPFGEPVDHAVTTFTALLGNPGRGEPDQVAA